jgi:UDP-glucose 4-epimerase
LKKIVILGASGYIGSYLANYLQNSHDIYCHSRKKIQKIRYSKNIVGDIKKKKIISEILKIVPDIIIYTISYNHFDSEKNKKKSIENNYKPLSKLVEQIKKKKLKTKIIYFSTMQVYGREFKKKLINEKTQKKINNIYSLTHSMCEDLLLKNYKKVNSCSLRLSNTYGMPILKKINCWWLVINDFCKSAIDYKKIIINSDGTAQRDFISLNDLCNFVDILIKKKRFIYPIVNVCSGTTVSIKNLAYSISRNNFFKKKVKVIIKEKSYKKNKQFKYDNTLMRKLGFKKISNFDKNIFNFLKILKAKK